MTTLHDPGTCSLRPAEARDAPGVVSSSRPRTSSLVERNGFWPRPMTEDYDELIDTRHVTVAERGEAIVGSSCSVHPWPTSDAGDPNGLQIRLEAVNVLVQPGTSMAEMVRARRRGSAWGTDSPGVQSRPLSGLSSVE
jgi:hypothetical protein